MGSKPRQFVVLLAAAGLISLCIAPLAQAQRSPSPFVRIASKAVYLLVGGDRYVAAVRDAAPGAKSFEVIDTKLRRVRTQKIPTDCIFGPALLADLYGARDRLLLQCADGAAIMDLRDGHFIARGLHDGITGWSSMGSEWLSNTRTYLNIRTGERRELDVPDVPSHLRDLDDPNLAPLVFCAPFQARSRYVPEQQSDGYVVLPFPENVLRPGFALGRCGRSGLKQLSKDLAVPDLSPDHGYTAWAQTSSRNTRCAQQMATYDIARKRTVRWPKTIPGCVLMVRHTKYAVIAAQDAGPDPHGEPSAPDELKRLWIAPRPSVFH